MALEFIPPAIIIECGKNILIPRGDRRKIVYRLTSGQIKFFEINSEIPDWAREIPDTAVCMSFEEFSRNQWSIDYGKPIFYYLTSRAQHKD